MPSPARDPGPAAVNRGIALAAAGAETATYRHRRATPPREQPAAITGLTMGGIFPSPASGSTNIVISPSVIPEPTDYGIIASKPQIQQLVIATLRNAVGNGAAVPGIAG